MMFERTIELAAPLLYFGTIACCRELVQHLCLNRFPTHLFRLFLFFGVGRDPTVVQPARSIP